MHALHAQVTALIEQVATDIVLPRFGTLRAQDISEKTTDDYVTIADKESEERLSEGLAEILPEAGIIGEEAVAADPSVIDAAGIGLQWIIDPIDGTGNFAAARAPFGIMIGLVQDGVPQAGWIYDPLERRMCHAVLGGGAWVNGERLTARESGEAVPIAALATYYLTKEEHAEIGRRATGHFTLVDIPRCAAEQYPRLALGQNDLALFERSHPWDHAPGALFLNEAGGRLLRRDGTAYRIGDGKKGLLGASSPRKWDVGARVLFG